MLKQKAMESSVVWITGASSGIGEALTFHFAEKGHKLIISSRNKDQLEQIKAKCQHPDFIHVLPLDLANSQDFGLKVQEAIGFFGKIDLLINNGGISQRSLAMETSLEVDRKIMEINYFGTIALSKAILPHFVQNKKGHFAVVTSLVGKFGTPYRSSYAASKHALHGFFDALRAEHHQDDLKVTLICPGFIHTNVSINALTGDGSPLNQMDEAQAKGMSAQACAREIYHALKNGKQEVYIGGKETFGVYLKRFFPYLFSKLLIKAKVR
jgi:dehydrogenase/reductase SDR family member 7B